MILNHLIVLLNISILLLVFYVLSKIVKIHKMQFTLAGEISNKTDTTISQIEALFALYKDLDIPRSLPRTRGWAGSPDFLLYIARLTETKKPKFILECSSGVSTVVLAQALKNNGHGHVYSMDHDNYYAEITRRELKRQKLESWATVIDAPIKLHHISGEDWRWYSIDNLPKELFDVIVIDGPPKDSGILARYPAIPMLIDNFNDDCTIVLDDADREDEQEIIKRWSVDYPSLKITTQNCEKGCVSISA